jgi:hypothetical protein
MSLFLLDYELETAVIFRATPRDCKYYFTSLFYESVFTLLPAIGIKPDAPSEVDDLGLRHLSKSQESERLWSSPAPGSGATRIQEKHAALPFNVRAVGMTEDDHREPRGSRVQIEVTLIVEEINCFPLDL